MQIHISTVPHETQRYNTVGDWITHEENKNIAPNATFIHVSQIPDERMEFLIAVHELIEWFLCKEHNVSAHQVTDFDEWFEENTIEGRDGKEPGDSMQAPYYHEHRFASAIERLLAHELNIDWSEYERAIERLSHPTE